MHVKEVKTEAKASGGEILGRFRRRRGKIFGHDLSGKDDVPALLTRGEFVQNVRAVDYYGADFMRALNALKIPKNALPRFATGGLVSAKVDTSFIKSINANSPEVQALIEELRAKFNKEKGRGFYSWLNTAKKWRNIYGKEYIKVSPSGYNINYEGIAKQILSASYAAKNGGESSNAINRNVNLNFNIGKNQNYSVLSDEATANALERYFKGLGL